MHHDKIHKDENRQLHMERNVLSLVKRIKSDSMQRKDYVCMCT